MREFIRQQFERFFIGAVLNFERSLDNEVAIAKKNIDEVKTYLNTAKQKNHPDAEVYKTMLKQNKAMLNGKLSLKNNFAEIKDKIILAVRGVFATLSESERSYT